MTRVNGRSPAKEEDTRPPRLPWVLLCYRSEGACGTVWTVNRFDQWRDAIKSRHAHEALCAVSPRPILVLPGDMIT